MKIGVELIDTIDADVIVTSYLPDHGEGPETIVEDLDRIAPGARHFLHAFADDRVLSYSRYEVYPPSFEGLKRTLLKINLALSIGAK